MKTSIKKRLLRLGILCAGIGSFAVAVFAAVTMDIVEGNFANLFGNTVIGSVMNSMHEELSFLPNGLKEAVPGEHNDIYEDVFMLGDTRSYDYKDFENESRALAANGVNITYIPSGNIYLVAYNRGSDIIVGELVGTYFDYATDIMKSSGTWGYVVNTNTGKIMVSTDLSKIGSSVSGDKIYDGVLAKAKSGVAAHEGNSMSSYVIFSSPVADHNEFTVIFASDASNIYSGGKIAIALLLVWAGVLTTIGTVVSIGVAKKIALSITVTTDCLEKFSRGEIDTSFRANDRGDETEVLSQAMERTIQNLGSYIKDIDYMLSEISKGNLTAESSISYEGEFNNIKTSLNNISASLRSTFVTIREAGDQVNSGAGSLASGAQNLANNSTTEASTIKELDSLIKGINENVTANAEMTDRMRNLSEQTVRNVETGNENMKNLSGAIEDIRKASEEIQSIAKLIDDIAFQTNILALNAAVEAARAGDAGKGFAVVADEVRNLASKSAEAAKDAVQVIGRCVSAVDQGVQLNESASRSLEQVSESVREFSVLVGKVADSSSQQAVDIGTVTNGLTSITEVVQNNAATAQQSAASSEELASQAQVLEHQLRNFRI